MTKRHPDVGLRSGLPNRRKVLQLGGGLAAGVALGFPAIGRAQSDKIRIGHLTPMTGFLGVLGEWAVLGIRMAAEEINAAGGVLGRQIEVASEDSINPDAATTKAQRMLERDGVALLMGEISSASALAISQVAARNKRMFMALGPRSDTLRGKSCNRYMFCTDIPNTVMVNAVGSALLRDGMVKGKKFHTLTADYVFGHDLLRAAKAFFAANGATLTGDELVATDVTDFSPYMVKIRQARPDIVCLNLAGNQVTNFVKQYSEFGLSYPTVGFNLNTADAWAAGKGNLSGTWPTVWYHTLDTPGSKAFVAAFQQEVQQDAGEPRLDRVHRAQAGGAGDGRGQIDRHREAHRVLREGRGVRHPEGAQGLLPPLGPPADPGGLPVLGQGQPRRPVRPDGARRRRTRHRQPLETIYPTREQNPCSL